VTVFDGEGVTEGKQSLAAVMQIDSGGSAPPP
jgi:hypothetical protein